MDVHLVLSLSGKRGPLYYTITGMCDVCMHVCMYICMYVCTVESGC